MALHVNGISRRDKNKIFYDDGLAWTPEYVPMNLEGKRVVVQYMLWARAPSGFRRSPRRRLTPATWRRRRPLASQPVEEARRLKGRGSPGMESISCCNVSAATSSCPLSISFPFSFHFPRHFFTLPVAVTTSHERYSVCVRH